MTRTKQASLRTGALLVMLALAAPAFPCGDKLMVVVRGGRTGANRNAPHRGAILLFAEPGSSVEAAMSGGDLKKGLERAGHRVRTVTARADLRTAIESGSYDVVLADPKVSAEIGTDARSLANPPAVIATLFDPSPAELSAASAAIRCVVKRKGKPADYLSVVNDAITQRARAVAAKKETRRS